MAARTLVAIEARTESVVGAALNGFDLLESEQAVRKKVWRARSLRNRSQGLTGVDGSSPDTWILRGMLAERDGGERNRKQKCKSDNRLADGNDFQSLD